VKVEVSTDREEARDSAFCCFGLLACGADTVERVISLLPAARQDRIRECMQQVRGLPSKELTDRLRHVREESTAAELKRVAAYSKVSSLETLPPALQQWLCARAQEGHGREDHQG
jgi:hypothetical protein